jgi:hypothetical protein
MTYRGDCGGEKFFRNVSAKCGEDQPRMCSCGGTQNSHLKLLEVFGPGTSIIPPPTVSVLTPTAGSTVANAFTAHALAFSKRGVGRVELWLNGFKWAETKGAPFGGNGQPESAYTLATPGNVPNGVIDVVAKAYDDLEIVTSSAPVTVMKGAACQNAATDCAAGQKCDAGKCFWDPPNGKLGDACTFNQFCTSGLCSGTADQQICTMTCITEVADSCPTGFECVSTGGNSGICFPPSAGGGCCSVGGGSDAGWVHFGLGAVVIGLVLRRRKRL